MFGFFRHFLVQIRYLLRLYRLRVGASEYCVAFFQRVRDNSLKDAVFVDELV
jgi:hypothetical protein